MDIFEVSIVGHKIASAYEEYKIEINIYIINLSLLNILSRSVPFFYAMKVD
jgi:hypothetical protein